MIFLLFGQDSFSLNQKLAQIKEKYLQASPGTTISIIDGSLTNFQEILSQAAALPFLSSKRLVIIKNIISQGQPTTKERLANNLEKIPSSTILIFAEYGLPDKKDFLFQKLISSYPFQEFRLPTGFGLVTWIRKEVEKRRKKISLPACQKLANFVGSDLWRLNSEIEKLDNYTKGEGKETISPEDIDLLVKPEISPKIFNLVDSLGEKNLTKALQELATLLSAGENPLYIFSMINFQFRNLVLIKGGEKNLSLHPYVLAKTRLLAKNFSLEELKRTYQKLASFDLKIKTGKIEPETGLYLLIGKIIKGGR